MYVFVIGTAALLERGFVCFSLLKSAVAVIVFQSTFLITFGDGISVSFEDFLVPCFFFSDLDGGVFSLSSIYVAFIALTIEDCDVDDFIVLVDLLFRVSSTLGLCEGVD